MKILMVIPTLTQPRFHKRIESLDKNGFDLRVFGFNRGLYVENTIKNREVSVLGSMDNKNYFKRLNVYFKIIKLIIQNRSNVDLFYFFTIDFAVLGMLFLPKNKYVYEIGDFAYLGLKKKLIDFITKIDLKIISNSLVTVLTSSGFKKYLLTKKEFEMNKFLVIPNKVNPNLKEASRTRGKIDSKSLTFGFVGILRYPKTVFRFVKIIAENYPQHKFVFYGDGGLTKEFILLTKSYSNLHYGGTFKNPDDLSRIYNSFDIHLACYDISTLNQQLAEPNKFYESIFFSTPIIATTNSFLGENVENLNLGFSIDASKDENIKELIDSFTDDSLNSIRQQMFSISKDELINSDIELINRLKGI